MNLHWFEKILKKESKIVTFFDKVQYNFEKVKLNIFQIFSLYAIIQIRNRRDWSVSQKEQTRTAVELEENKSSL